DPCSRCLWVGNKEVLAKFDPAANKKMTTLRLQSTLSGMVGSQNVRDIVAAFDSVWVSLCGTSGAHGQVRRIDHRAGEMKASLAIPGAGSMVAGEEFVLWCMSRVPVRYSD